MKKCFLTGLVILLPAAITIAIVIFIVNFLTKPFVGIVTKLLSHTGIHTFNFFFLSSDQVIRYASKLIILVGLIILILLIGFIANWVFFRAFFNVSNRLLGRIPLFNKVYKTVHDIIATLFATDIHSFKQVVLVPFPYEGTYSLGLVARESPKTCQDAMQDELLSVFIPTTPNPTTGLMMMFRKKDIIYLDMKTQEAVKYIVSCGVIAPEKHAQVKQHPEVR